MQPARYQCRIGAGVAEAQQVRGAAHAAAGDQFQVRCAAANLAAQVDDARTPIRADRSHVEHDHPLDPERDNFVDQRERAFLECRYLRFGPSFAQIQTEGDPSRSDSPDDCSQRFNGPSKSVRPLRQLWGRLMPSNFGSSSSGKLARRPFLPGPGFQRGRSMTTLCMSGLMMCERLMVNGEPDRSPASIPTDKRRNGN